ncbi:hypothetical protein CDL15_Pgr029173 [Punica granatum]|uniref:Uncharacterized protein n=1 Tax=Punica granatum TaxID=22663 RepID=A0A218XEQ4_PUNGR|nr:hypothetical protein CDL15_Pgr029173 [Punica granatum]
MVMVGLPPPQHGREEWERGDSGGEALGFRASSEIYTFIGRPDPVFLVGLPVRPESFALGWDELVSPLLPEPNYGMIKFARVN